MYTVRVGFLKKYVRCTGIVRVISGKVTVLVYCLVITCTC